MKRLNISLILYIVAKEGSPDNYESILFANFATFIATTETVFPVTLPEFEPET